MSSSCLPFIIVFPLSLGTLLVFVTSTLFPYYTLSPGFFIRLAMFFVFILLMRMDGKRNAVSIVKLSS